MNQPTHSRKIEMVKSIAVQIVMLSMAMFMTADVYAQRGRGRQANQLGGDFQNGRQHDRQPAHGHHTQRGQGNGNPQNVGVALTANEIQRLVLMREEEKLARDVYTALNAKWDENVFANISRAESKHLSAIGNLLSRYNIPDPVTNNAPGAFTNARFQQLYTSFVATGSNSLVDAFKVGLKIEEMDIVDLRVAIKSTNHQDIQRVLGNLLRGSRNHLRAFASRLNAVGGGHVATRLSQADFNQIASSQPETGRANRQSDSRGYPSGQQRKGRGSDKGNGQGSGNSQGNPNNR